MIIRRKGRPKWTTLDNQLIEDDRLSFKALGMLVYLLSRPDGWEAQTHQLERTHADGSYAVRSALKELASAGYFERRREQGPDGQFVWASTIRETAETADQSAESHIAVSAMRETAPLVSTDEQETEKESSSSEHPEVEPPIESPPSSAPTAPSKRGTRLPDQFVVSELMRTWAAENVPDVDWRDQTARFCDYWRAQPGAKGVKLDWIATWRNWLRTANERRPHARQNAQSRQQDAIGAYAAARGVR